MKKPIPSDPRALRGLAIVAKGDHIEKEGKNKWHVPSQSDPTILYLVVRWAGHTRKHPTRWQCSCPDHQTRGLLCKHIYAVRFIEGVATPHTPVRAVRPAISLDSPEQAVACKFCGCERVKRNGFKSGKQEYRCLSDECGRAFVQNEGFARLKADPKAICLALDMHFKGVSLRSVTETLESFFDIKVDHTTVYRWIQRYVKLISEYAAKLEPVVGEKWHADEVFTKFSGDVQYLWHVMDADTRYLLVSRVTTGRDEVDARAAMREAKRLAGKAPTEIVTDGLAAYERAVRTQLHGTTHTREIHISKPERYPQNNIVERLNGTVRGRQKTTRGLKKPDGPLTAGQQAYYNLMRPHQALDGATPAEAAGIQTPRRKGESRIAATIRQAFNEESKIEVAD